MSRRARQYQDTVAPNKEAVIVDGSVGSYVSPVHRLTTEFWATSSEAINVYVPSAATAIQGEQYKFALTQLEGAYTLAVTLRDNVLGPSLDWPGNFVIDAENDHIILSSNGTNWVVVDNQIAA